MSIPRPWRAVLIGTALAVMAVQTPAVAQAPPEADKIDRVVRADLAADDKATFWVRLKDKADLRSARTAKTKADKGRQVYRMKTETATASQAGVRKLLKSAGADFTPFWIVNTIKVTGDADLAAEIAKLPEVAEIAPDEIIELPEPKTGVAQAMAGTVEWNVDRVNAPKVWDELGDRGEGIVIASLDSGVQWDHPALIGGYRGTQADGTVDHNYNWYDPTGACPNRTPCDDRGHGTHVTGTLAGAGGIGVAPGAKWITTKGCGIGGCPGYALLAAGEWILAPTDLGLQNPRPDLAPDIVNNSWGRAGLDLWYKEIVEAWVAAGIFPAFSNGNNGPECTTTGSPGGYAAAYSAGSFDVNGAIMPESSRGPGENGEVKPNIAAPGVNVRSAVPGSAYGIKSGTSMASPHVAATVALMWSASPALRGDVEATRALLDGSASDVDATYCGGTAADNFTFGEGKLDAYAAVKATPAGELGTLTGKVTSEGDPVAGATISVSGPLSRTVPTGQDGTYTLPRLLSGDYEITVKKFGYDDATSTATVADNQTATKDLTMTPQPMSTVSGMVSSTGVPEAGVTVSAAGTPATAVTDAAGRYELQLPHKEYDLNAVPPSRCSTEKTVPVTVTGATTKDIELPANADAYGHTCRSGREPYVEATDKQPLTWDDEYQTIDLPFAFPFYGKTYTSGMASTNGFLSFGGHRYSYPNNMPLPTTGAPNAGIYPYWDDLALDEQGGLYTATLGTAPNRTFVIEWRNARFYDHNEWFSFEALLGEDGSIGFRYRGIATSRAAGEGATIGIENGDGTDALQYSADLAAIADGQSLGFAARQHGLVTGTVADANDGKPLAGATVKVGAAASFTTGADGTFFGQAPAGDHVLEVAAENYGTLTKDVTVKAGERNLLDTALTTGRVTASTDHLTLVMPAAADRKGTVELTNTGADTTYTIEIDPGQSGWLGATPAGGEIAAGTSATLEVTASSAGMEPGSVRTGVLVVRSASGRNPAFPVLVSVVVPKHQVAVDAGGGRSVTDAAGDTWAADRRYTPGRHGYLAESDRTSSTGETIAGTNEQKLFGSVREDMREYRFDNVPDGVYTVELGFAETRHKQPGKRVFDVAIEGAPFLWGLDLVREAGPNTAVSRRFTVRVTDGHLNVTFHKRIGDPVLSFIRITERPDRAVS
ncbi:S8 family serine peptidase [Nonomuraea turkmeniaca]|uniref:S8 family serine peptidase n=1 Tax=Nonomuraea turkmeniaca TaxID=103838 RepID=UPI001FE8D512|nr:S8 family serine peptidase [Nonomuraea turkmeniaca]